MISSLMKAAALFILKAYGKQLPERQIITFSSGLQNQQVWESHFN